MTKTKYAVDAATKRIRFKRKLKLNLWCWMFMSLAVGFYILFQGYPIICSIQYSLLDWSGMTSNATFIGLQNYKELMHDELFWNAFINSFKYMVMIVPLELAVSLFLAYLLNDEKMKGRGLYRTMYCSCSYDCFCSGNYHDIHFGSSGTGQSSFGHTTYSAKPD